MMRAALSIAVVLGLALAGLPAAAQDAVVARPNARKAKPRTGAMAPVEPAPAKKPAKDPGTPLSTIMNTHLYADVPEAKDFVRASRPSPETLDYQPITPQLPGSDPVRPRPRDAKQLGALEREMDGALARNKRAGNALNRHVKAAE